MRPNSDIDLSRIHIHDQFWDKYRRLIGEQIIPYQWDILNDRIEDAESSHCISNLRIAAGLDEGPFQGAVFQDTDLYKWLEAVGFYLSSYGRDERIEAWADSTIALMKAAQQPDGYLDTYFIINEPDRRWKNLMEGHELYAAGHLFEAAVAYYEGTGKREILDIATRLADLLVRTFGNGEDQIHGYPGHPEVELGLVKLYRATGNRDYLNLAQYFVDARGCGENYFLQEQRRSDFRQIWPDFADYDPAYSQSHLPVRRQRTVEGHAVRAVYLYSAMADLAQENGDQELEDACKELWNNLTHRRMFITGGIGSSGFLERFTTDYDLPNDSNYSESCASIGLAMFGKRMARLTGEASYMDTVEYALYNTVLAGIAMDGKSFYYVNPLEVWPSACMLHTSRAHVRPQRQKWFGVACCPPNIARTLASVGQYAFALHDDTLYVNLYMGSTVQAEIGGSEVTIETATQMPWQGKVDVAVTGTALQGSLALRIPEYAGDGFRVTVDGQDYCYEVRKGYAVIPLTGQEMHFSIVFPMNAVYVHANPRVRADNGKAALRKGPLVYCLEEVDNGADLSAVYMNTRHEITETYEEDCLDGTIVLHVDGWREQEWSSEDLYAAKDPVMDPVELTAIPYCYWGNRRPGEEMTVWVKEMRG